MKTKLILTVFAFFAIFSIQAQDKKVAVVGFYSDKELGIKNLDEKNQTLINAFSKFSGNPDFKLDGILEKFHKKFFNDYAKKFPFKILKEDSVLNDANYNNFKAPKKQWDDNLGKNVLVYEGYKFIPEGFIGKKNVKAIAATLKDKSDGVMFVNVDFDLTAGKGIGGTRLIRIIANVKIVVYNSEGKRVFKFRQSARSKKTMTIIARVPVIKTNKIMNLCDDAMERLLKDLDDQIAEITRKSGDKL